MMLWSGDLYMISDHTAVDVNFDSNIASIEYYNVKYPDGLQLDFKELLENWQKYQVNPTLENVVNIESVFAYTDSSDQTVLRVHLNIIEMKEFLLALGFDEMENDYFYFSDYNSELGRLEQFSFSLGFIPSFRLELKSEIFDDFAEQGRILRPVPVEWIEDQY